MTKRTSIPAWIVGTIVVAALGASFAGRQSPAAGRRGGGEPPPTSESAPLEAAASRVESAPARARPIRPMAGVERGADPERARVLAHVVETAHYRVSSDLGREPCVEAAELLERAWPIWCKRFDVAQGYDPGPGRFSVKLYGTDALLVQAISRETGFRVSCLGFVDFSAYRMFALKHSDAYEFRRILLHEGTHQFLYRLIGAEAAAKLPRWYDEGCAHEAEKHLLDGDRLELFQHSGGWFSPQPAFARRYLRSNGITVEDVFGRDPMDLAGDYNARACGWAIVHFLRSDAGPHEAAWFREWEQALHSGFADTTRADLVARLASLERVTPRLIRFLDGITQSSGPTPESSPGSRR